MGGHFYLSGVAGILYFSEFHTLKTMRGKNSKRGCRNEKVPAEMAGAFNQSEMATVLLRNSSK